MWYVSLFWPLTIRPIASSSVEAFSLINSFIIVSLRNIYYYIRVCIIFISPSTELGSYLKLWHMGRVVWPWTLSQCMISRAQLCLTPRIISTRVGVINFSYYSYSKLDDQWYNWWVVPLILWKFWNWLLTKIKLSVLVQQARVVVVVGMRYIRRSFTTKGFVFTFSNC